MDQIFLTASLWFALAVASALIASFLRLSIALVEICVGVLAVSVTGFFGLNDVLAPHSEWIRFLASSGAVLLTFLAGAELDPVAMRSKLREVNVIGFTSFAAPFAGGAAVAFYGLHWDANASLLCGIALSTTSMAVVYAVLLETGLNKTEFGKGILGSCFVTDLLSVLALGILFAPFTFKTWIFIGGSIAALSFAPAITAWLTAHYAYRTAAIRTKWILLLLFGLGALALWAESEPVLPAYLTGMMLAGAANTDGQWIRRLRTLTVGLLTPFYFLRAGTLVSIQALSAAPFILIILLLGKVVSKIFGLYPLVARFRRERDERWYYTLLMSTGLTFGTIASLFGLSHGLVSQEQYSLLVAAVIASAVVPTMIANAWFLPRHLISAHDREGRRKRALNGLSEEG
ncbi:MAG TPA: cation:proton antiporter [Nitrospira sp.]|nr:cation:proton antiporter [Nitrospira sp.]